MGVGTSANLGRVVGPFCSGPQQQLAPPVHVQQTLVSVRRSPSPSPERICAANFVRPGVEGQHSYGAVPLAMAAGRSLGASSTQVGRVMRCPLPPPGATAPPVAQAVAPAIPTVRL